MFAVIFEYSVITVFGGSSYMVLEILWRNHTHWSMGICGGLCFLCIYCIENRFPKMHMLNKCIMCTLVITLLELITGCIVNIAFDLNVWDYSDRPLNLFGQICLLFSLLWFLLSIPALKLASYIKNTFFSQKTTCNNTSAEI